MRLKNYVYMAVVLAFLAPLLVSCQQVLGLLRPAAGNSRASIPVSGKSAGQSVVGQPTETSIVLPTRAVVINQNLASKVNEVQAATATQVPTSTALALAKPGPAVQKPAPPTAPANVTTLSPEDWKSWPVLPKVPEGLKAVYRRGLEQGNDPQAFSILGDCQSQPEVFMSVFDDDPGYVSTLPAPLQRTVANFSGSFNRYSPTVKDATTEGALLWVQWNDNKEKKCKNNETPIDCELRVHRPSIVFVHVGTHWEARNRRYLEIIIHKILDHGAIPILVTKADNREKDERVNKDMTSLAAQFHLPLWNFWASVHNLPNGGLKPGSDMYLTDEGLAIHRMGALQALDSIWRALQE